ncbi:MAG: hypothetical protein GWO41_11590 [candidate division Zixibacteria bacterium]|nr:hypothetical protein [candidate division Zixibacteria bacterium]NIR63189.1 hypothetical protein [candidate division Zixibacteria bacterium]NIS16973.1 hypothetical protein [candidate division Zixibacteria bacterium]NIS45167.1 hypothetical protein [candidate division Zixibacteria bacterium]NIT53351.1 hypothetical protein [candidate division Zixibacteria bacterium]
MKHIAIIILFLGAGLIACGNGGQDQNITHKSEDYQKAEQERFAEYGYEPPPPPVKGPQVPVDSLNPGTCAYTVAKFSQALAAVDSAEAMKYCSDTTKLIVRAMFINTTQLKNLQRLRDKGMYIKSVAIEGYSRDSSICQACVTAVLDSVPNEACGFKLRRVGGEWKIFQLGG